MGTYLSNYIVFGVGWHVDSGALRYMIFSKSLNRIQVPNAIIQVKLAELWLDFECKMQLYKWNVLIIGTSVSFHMALGDVLELHNVLYILGWSKNLLLVSAMTNLRCVAKFDSQQFNIRDHSQDLGRVLVRGIREVDLYKLFADLIKLRDLLHDRNQLCELWRKRQWKENRMKLSTCISLTNCIINICNGYKTMASSSLHMRS